MNFWNSDLLPLNITLPVSVNRTDPGFLLTAPRKESDFNRYCRALIKEIRAVAPEFDDYRIPCVMLYAGSPSLLSQSRDLEHVLENTAQYFPLTEDYELLIRLDPERKNTLASGQALLLPEKARLEIRVISSREEELSAIRFPYHVDDITATVDALHQTQPDRVLAAVLFLGLPHQTMESWKQTLACTDALGFDQITIYLWDPSNTDMLMGLYEPGERAFVHSLPLPDPAFMEEAYAFAADFLQQKGYGRIRRRIFAKPGKEARIDQIRLTNPNYLGIGAGAKTFLAGNGYRNTEDLSVYETTPESFQDIAQDFVMFEEADLVKQGVQYLLEGKSGLNSENFRLIYPADPVRKYESSLENLIRLGYVCRQEDAYFLTSKGLCHLKELPQLLK